MGTQSSPDACSAVLKFGLSPTKDGLLIVGRPCRAKHCHGVLVRPERRDLQAEVLRWPSPQHARIHSACIRAAAFNSALASKAPNADIGWVP